MRICNMTRIPGGAQEHAFRHLIFPKLHRLTENAGLDLCCAQMGCCCQTIRPRADDCHLIRKSSFYLHVHAFRDSLLSFCSTLKQAVSSDLRLVTSKPSHRDAAIFGSMVQVLG